MRDYLNSSSGRYSMAVLAHIALLVAWHLFVRMGDVPRFVMPSPGDTFNSLLSPNYDWWGNTLVTGTEIFAGYFLALVVGVLLALLFTWSRTLEALVLPLLVTLNMIPKVALGPLFIVWFKYGIFPNTMMAFSIAVFPILLNTAKGLREIEPDLLDLVRSLHGSRWQLFTKIQLPGSLPYVFAGMKVAAILAVAGAIVGEIRVFATDAIDFRRLPRRKRFGRIEAPGAPQQPLAAQDLVAAGDAAGEVVGDVEEGAVAVGDARIQGQQLVVHLSCRHGGADPLEHEYRPLGPDAPVAEQSAADPHGDRLAVAQHLERCEQVEHDVIVVAGVEGDAILGACRHDAADHVERAVAVERRHLDGHDVVDGGEAAPEFHGQRDAPHRGLQVEADQRDHPGDGFAVLDQFVERGVLHRCERQQPGVVAVAERDLRFAAGLFGAAGETGDHHQRTVGPLARHLRRLREHRLVEADVADRELGGVHAHGQPAGARVEVVAAQCALVRGVELALSVERERVGRYCAAFAQQRERLGGQV